MAKHHEGFVDAAGLFESIPSIVCARGAFASRKIDKRKLYLVSRIDSMYDADLTDMWWKPLVAQNLVTSCIKRSSNKLI